MSSSMTHQLRTGAQDGGTGTGPWHQGTQHCELCFPHQGKHENQSLFPDPWCGYTDCAETHKTTLLQAATPTLIHFVSSRQSQHGKAPSSVLSLRFQTMPEQSSKNKPREFTGSNCPITATLVIPLPLLPQSNPLSGRYCQVAPALTEPGHHSWLALFISLLLVLIISSSLLLLKLQ